MDSHAKQQAAPDLSVVVPTYEEEDNLHQLHQELLKVLPALDLSWEVIFIDDGSKDASWEIVSALNAADPRFKGVRLSRNFGHQYALFAGICHARGRAVISMDADLQHPPEVIPALIDEWRKGSKIVNTVRLEQEDLSLFKRVTSRWYYRVFSLLGGVEIKAGMADFRLLDRIVVDSVLQLREGGLFLRGLIQWMGYPAAEVAFQPRARFGGRSKYTMMKMLKFAWAGISSFSIVPLRIGIFIGIATSFLAFVELFFVIYLKLFTDTLVPGWASVVGITSFLFGILFIMLGIIGEYIGRILWEVKSRPRFLVHERAGLAADIQDTTSRTELAAYDR